MRRRTPRDRAPGGMRDRVSQTAAQAWQEPVIAHYLGRATRTKVRFTVPGLRRDGTRRGVATTSWLLIRIPRWIGTALWLVVTVLIRLLVVAVQIAIDAALGGTAASYDSPTFAWRRTVTVTADDSTYAAVSFGHALHRKRGHLWLITSPHRCALTQIAGGTETVLWQAGSPYQPVLSSKDAELRWRDGSRVSFSWPRGERQVLHMQYAAAQRN